MALIRTPVFRWTALLTLAAGWRLLLFVGPLGSDDIVYSEAAWSIAGGHFPKEPSIHALRLGYVGIIGFIYALLGAGSFSLVILNLAASLAEIALAWRIAREFLDERGAWLSAVLVALLPIHVFLATEAHPDMPLAALSSLSVLLLLRGRQGDRAVLLFAAGAVLGSAHLMKETAFFGLAPLLILAGRPRPRLLWVLAGFAVGPAIEAAVFTLLTGDPLFRVHGVMEMQSDAMGSEYYLSSVPTFRRLFLDVPLMLFIPASGAFAAFCLLPAAAAGGGYLSFRTAHEDRWRLILWPVLLIGLLTFWPISIVPYRPALVAHPRIFVVAGVPMAILAALLLQNMRPRPAFATGGVLALSLLAGGVYLTLTDRASTEGARRAFEQLPESGPVVSDPRTLSLFRLYDGYAGAREWREWEDVPDAPHTKVINESWIVRLESWYGMEPPAGFMEEDGRPIYRAEFSERPFRRKPLRRIVVLGVNAPR